MVPETHIAPNVQMFGPLKLVEVGVSVGRVDILEMLMYVRRR